MTTIKLNAEQLEARDLPSLFGNPWGLATELTMSFAPDGVFSSHQTRGHTSFTSRLYTELNGSMAQSVWKEELLRAMHTWTAVANINVGFVPDSGRAFGPQGFVLDSPAATIRVGTIVSGPDVLATSNPNSPLAGAYAGNVMLNEAFTYTLGGGNGTYDLYTVALQEFGNALGLADSLTYTSAMYGHYLGGRTGLSAADVLAVQALYGLRLGDAHEGLLGNNTFGTAKALSNGADPTDAGKVRAVADGDITTAADADFYRFTTTSGTTSVTIRLGTAGKSLLAGRLEVYDASGQLIGTATNTSPLQGDTVLVLSGLSANATYTVKVSAGRADTFNTGSYQLRVGNGYDPKVETKIDRVQRFGSDGGTNETRFTATALTPTSGYAANTRYEWTGRIGSAGDSDYYRLTAPLTGGAMTVTVQSDSGLMTSATVYNALGQLVASNVLLNWEGGYYRAQVPVTVPGATYFVQLKVQDPDWSAASGNYGASVDFGLPAVTTVARFTGTATASSKITHGIEVRESGTFVFRLSATSTNTAVLNWIEARLFNQSGQLVAVWGTDGKASTDTRTMFLSKGKYAIQILPFYNSASSTVSIVYALGLNRLSDPIDPYAPPDPTSPPPPPPPPPPPEEEDDVIIVTPPFNPWTP